MTTFVRAASFQPHLPPVGGVNFSGEVYLRKFQTKRRGDGKDVLCPFKNAWANLANGWLFVSKCCRDSSSGAQASDSARLQAEEALIGRLPRPFGRLHTLHHPPALRCRTAVTRPSAIRTQYKRALDPGLWWGTVWRSDAMGGGGVARQAWLERQPRRTISKQQTGGRGGGSAPVRMA